MFVILGVQHRVGTRNVEFVAVEITANRGHNNRSGGSEPTLKYKYMMQHDSQMPMESD